MVLGFVVVKLKTDEVVFCVSFVYFFFFYVKSNRKDLLTVSCKTSII